MKTTPVVILAVAVVLVVGAAIWFLQMGPTAELETPAATPKPLLAQPAPPSGPVRGTPIPTGPTAAVPSEGAAPATAATAQPLAEWEERITKVLSMNATELDTAQMLISMLPTLPPDGQAEAAQHISNLILDKDYGRVMPLVRNPALPQEVHDVLFTDLMNREDGVKLPALLEVAKIPTHPFHEEALTDLQIFLDQDNENNWGKWDSAVKDYIKKQAAEDAAAEAPVPADAPVPTPQ